MAVNPYAAPSADLETDTANEVPLADRGARFAANFVDGLVFVVPYILFAVWGSADSAVAIGIGGLLFLALIVYQVVKATTTGQTIGKKLLQIKVVKSDGRPVDFVSIILMRGFVGQVLLAIIPLYGLIDALFIFRDDQRCVHDIVGSTKVIKAK